MGSPPDLSLVMPGTGTPPVPTPAGGDSVPMDDVVMSQPVIAYFTFIQNNLNQLTGGNAQQVMREAEQRHLQIMNEVLQGLRNEFNSRLIQKDQECQQKVQDAESKALAATKVAQDRCKEVEDRLTATQAAYDTKFGDLQTEANQLHSLKLEEERRRITKEFEASYAQTVEEAQQAIAAIQKRCDDQIAVEQARTIRIKAELEQHQAEMEDKLNEAAVQNLNLQDQIDDLQSKLDQLANAQRTGTHRTAAPKVETATGDGVPTFQISTPKAPETAKAANEGAVPELKTPAVLAQEAKAKLENMLKTSNQAEPAAGDGKPKLPARSPGFFTPTEHVPSEPAKTPPNESPKNAKPHQQQIMGTSDLIELVKALTSRDEKDKPKTEEAEVIKLNNMPAPESYRNWKNHVRDEVKSCSDRPDEAWAWLNDVYDQTCTRQELEAKLQDPGKFLTLDTKLSAALTRSAGGDLATRILNYKEQQSRKGIQVRGRYVLLMFEDYFKTSEEAGSLYRVEDLLGVVKVGDSVQDLRRFVNKWDATLAGMASTPEDAVLRDILLRQIRPSHLLKYDIEVFDRASEKSHEKSYSFLHQSMKNLIDRERLRENRNRIAEKNKSGGPKDTKAAPAKGDGRKGRKGSPSRGRSQERGKGDKICYKFQKGQCDKGKNCPYKHVKDDKARTKSPRRKNTRSPSRGNKGDKGKKLSKEEMAKTPCIYYAQGKCNRGDKCYYKHEDKAAAATKDSPKRTNSPAPKKDKKGKDSNAAPCLIDRCQKFACIAKTKPKATSSLVHGEPVSMKRIRFRKSVHIIEVPAVGTQRPVRHRPREYSNVYRTSQDVPASSKVEQHEAQVRARQLQETVKLHDSDVAPSCGFCCWNEDTSDIT